VIRITLAIEPVAKGRPRLARSGHTYTPPKTRTFENTVAVLARREYGAREPLGGPLNVSMRFVFVPGKSVKRKHHTVKPDCSNLIKGVEDALNGIVWRDDSQIVQVEGRKLYDVSGGRPRIEVTVEELAT
jgi:Holliday junction resolvase RusA-like endonuclease